VRRCLFDSAKHDREDHPQSPSSFADQRPWHFGWPSLFRARPPNLQRARINSDRARTRGSTILAIVALAYLFDRFESGVQPRRTCFVIAGLDPAIHRLREKLFAKHGDYTCVLFSLARKAAGATNARHSLRPQMLGRCLKITRVNRAAGTRRHMCLTRGVIRGLTRVSIFLAT
jgi:hypothetical protein